LLKGQLINKDAKARYELLYSVSMNRRSLDIDRNELSFRYTKSGGPGGQHSNKVNTRVELTWSITDTVSFSEIEKELLVQRLGPKVRVVVSKYRSQKRNKDLALEKLTSLVERNLRTEPKRVPSKPSASKKRKRVDDKRKRGELKRQRRGDDYFD
jgi:ribosome-associated protein